MLTLYSDEASYALPNAQRNLNGRTHYVDEGTLRFHKSRILSAHAVENGLLFTIIESMALDMNNTKRGFRYVVFDLFGHVISRVDLEHAFRSKEQARMAMWAFLETIDAKAITAAAIEREEKYHAEDMRRLRETLAKL